jgi:hypothetical protein
MFRVCGQSGHRPSEGCSLIPSGSSGLDFSESIRYQEEILVVREEIDNLETAIVDLEEQI